LSLESELAEQFKRNDWKWTLLGVPSIPDEQDILNALDDAAKDLYTEPVGAELHFGRLIIRKKHRGFDVYCFVGQYE
jgi:hypothetical protein